MKKLKTLMLLLFIPMCGFGMDRVSALSMIETGDNDRAVGRAGEISRYQVRKNEWQSVTNSVTYSDSETAKVVLLQIMDRRIHSFQATFGRSPTDFEFYALWNAPTQALQGRVSPRVAERCQRFANLCEKDRQLAQASRAVRPNGQRVF